MLDVQRAALEVRRRPADMSELQKVKSAMQARRPSELHRYSSEAASYDGTYPRLECSLS